MCLALLGYVINFSVAIRTYNRAERLPRLFAALRSQANTQSFRWEIVIVDNNSTDHTAQLIEQLAPTMPVPVRYQMERRQGASFARQAAVLEAQGPLIGFLDDDNIPAADWVQQAYEFGQAHPKAAAFGSQIHGDFEVPPPKDFRKIQGFLAIKEYGTLPRKFNADLLDLPAGALSAGDMHSVGNTLWFADTAEQLRTINLASGTQTREVFHGLEDLYGLHRFRGELFGLSVRALYKIDPKTGATEKVSDLPISGQVNGAATAPDGVFKGSGRSDVIVAPFGGADVAGGKGADRLFASDDGNRLIGGAGADRLQGGDGRDRLEGGGGKDRLIAERGNDRLEGGGGRDVFSFRRKDGLDRILDWQDGRDKIEFETGAQRLRDLTIRQRGDDVTIDYRKDGGKIVVLDAELDDFGRGDFVFSCFGGPHGSRPRRSGLRPPFTLRPAASR